MFYVNVHMRTSIVNVFIIERFIMGVTFTMICYKLIRTL